MRATSRRRAQEDQLRDLAAIADVALGQLDVDQFLNELLDRVRKIFNADTAAALLLDESHEYLVATAARGIEAEVRQGVRIPLGTGFAGKIASGKCPVVVERVDSNTVRNPLLWERGIESMLGVPLMAGGNVIGVLHVGSCTPRSFTPDDVQLLELAADRVALGTQSRILQAERSAAAILQRSFLPSTVMTLPNAEFAGRYVPAARGDIGGDWYDVFRLPSGKLCMVIGDVAGHGVGAAVVMGRARSALRAYALDNDRPEVILELLDRKLQYFETGYMVTALCAVVDEKFERLRITSAGHPAPVLATGDGSGTLIDVPIDPPLGVKQGIRRSAVDIELPPEGALLLYTDGLIERRRTDLDARFEILKDAVRCISADDACATVMRQLIGEEASEDDVAILTFYWNNKVEVGAAERSP